MSTDKGEGSDSDLGVKASAAAPTAPEAAGSPPGELPAECKYISGMRLWLVLVAVTLVAFLMLLDMSIISTVNAAALLHATEGT